MSRLQRLHDASVSIWLDTLALRDLGLMLAALSLARLASVYDPPLRPRRRDQRG